MSSMAMKFTSRRFPAIFVLALFGLALISATVATAAPARQSATAAPSGNPLWQRTPTRRSTQCRTNSIARARASS